MDPARVDMEKIAAAAPLRGRAVLEVGCGDGRLTGLITAEARSVTAVDPLEALVSRARERLGHLAGVELLVGSGEHLELRDGVFDVVIFSYSLHHQDACAALREACRLVAPGGDIVVIEPTVDSEYTRLVALFESDEPARLRAAQEALRSGIVSVVSEERYAVEHLFADADALVDCFVESFASGAASEEDAEERLRALLDERDARGQRVVTDTVCLSLCRPA